MKVCKSCGEKKPLSEFYKEKRMKDGHFNQCKSCRKEWYHENKEKAKENMKKWREENKQKRKEYMKKYQKENREKIKEYQKEWREENKEMMKEYEKRYYEENKEKVKEYKKDNKEKIKEYNKRYRQENAEKIKEYQKKNDKKYRQENAEKIKEYKKEWYQENKEKVNEYRRNKRETDPLFRLTCNIRKMVHRAIKTKRTEEIIGCSFGELKQHLENQFSEGMSWENYGQWHVDHIRPLSWFDLTNPDEVAKANHYTNLQPLWAEDNLSKGNRFEGGTE